MNIPSHTLPAAQFNAAALAYSKATNAARRDRKARNVLVRQHFAELLRCGWSPSAAMELAELVEATK